MDTIKIVDEINRDRRRFLGSAAMAVAAAQLGMTGPAAAQRGDTRIPAIKPGTHTSFGPLKQIDGARRAYEALDTVGKKLVRSACAAEGVALP